MRLTKLKHLAWQWSRVLTVACGVTGTLMILREWPGLDDFVHWRISEVIHLQMVASFLEWVWIGSWSLAGAGLGWKLQSLSRTVVACIVAGYTLMIASNWLSLGGWPVATAPALLALTGSAMVSVFYVLTENLKLSHQKLANYSRTLEQRVRERTQELIEKNQRLEQEIQERKQIETALRRSEIKFRHLFENSQVGILRSRIEDGLILDANQCCLEMFGYDSAEDTIGKKYTRDSYFDAESREKWYKHFAITEKFITLKLY